MLSTSLGTNDYLWPTDASKTITTVFGDIRPFRYHTGIDIRTYGINGLDIYAIEDGYVSRIAVSPLGYGKVIYIKMKSQKKIKLITLKIFLIKSFMMTLILLLI